MLYQLDTNHVVVDGISIGVLLRDFLLAYDKQLTPRLASNIGDYLKVLTETSRKITLDYWTTALKNREPTIFPEMNNVTYNKGPAQYHIFGIEIGLSSTFSDFSYKYGITLSNVISVGLGYLDDPEKTNASFIDSPSWISLQTGCQSYKDVQNR